MTAITITRDDGSQPVVILVSDLIAGDMVECWNGPYKYLGPWGTNVYRRLIDALDTVGVVR